ncbi:MAG: hypothetical protein M3439_11835 [Chloroflexota bacterium]|nr:hypothetical protein [Chloroflexota bacterium]
MTMLSDRQIVAVIGIVAVFYVAVAVQFMDHLQPLTGDEPFYVMTAISIVRDGDLDESNNYANRDYDEFYPDDPLPDSWNGWPAFPRTLPPHPATTDLDGLHTKHGLGLSVLIAAPYDLAGRFGALLVVLTCAVLVAVNMFLLARDALAPPTWAAAIAVMLAVSMPIAPYAALIFPEIPASLLLVYSVRRLAAPNNTPLTWMLTGASIGFLPWLHQRFVPTAIVLVCIALAKLWRNREPGSAVLALTPVAIGGISLIGYNLWLYGSPIQDTADHAGFNGLAGTVNAGFGLLLDAQWGLLVAAPIYVLALAGVPFWCRSSHVARLTLLALVPYILVVASYRVWWGEWGPPARYLVPIAPFAAGALAVAIGRLVTPGRVALIILWGVGMTLTLVGLMNPQRFYHQPNGANNLYAAVDDRLGIHLVDRLIAFQPFALSPLYQRTAAGIALAGLLAAIVLLVAIVPHVTAARTQALRNHPPD